MTLFDLLKEKKERERDLPFDLDWKGELMWNLLQNQSHVIFRDTK